MALELYRRKRNFQITPEPVGRRVRRSAGAERTFVVQKHAASRLHYDFRLELDGVLLSWAVPKGPSLNPADKRLAIHVEDHPIEYGDFEGTIPPKQYGAGTVLLWDGGTWTPLGDDPKKDYRKGSLKFELQGEKLRGRWALVRTRNAKYDPDKAWLLIKENDRYARRHGTIVDDEPQSVLSGRDIEEIARSPDRVWHSNKSAAENVKANKRRTVRKRRAVAKRIVTSTLAAGQRRALPDFVPPELATLVKEVPAGDDWVHEMKYDGYRMLARIDADKVELFSRNRNRWTDKFAAIARSVRELPAQSAWIDGEVVLVDADGRTSFQRLQNVLSLEDTSALQYYAFDLMFLDGRDLRKVPLLERKALLEKLLERAPANIHYSTHVLGMGEDFLNTACGHKLEGVIAKRAASAYIGKRTKDWLKIKCGLRQELVVGGFTDPGGSREGFGALLLGVHSQGKLRYAGKVGTGFNAERLRALRKRLDALAVKTSPFTNPPTGSEARHVHWVKPELVAEIAFTEWTSEGTVRHGAFQGLREDKKAKDVTREQPAKTRATTLASRRASATPPSAADSVHGVKLTHPDKVFYAEWGLTKRDLAQYYERIAPVILPHLEERPLMLLRCPDGWNKACFHQKHADHRTHPALDRVAVTENGKRKAYYLAANSVEALVALVQMGALELHPWGAKAPRQDHPDRLIFDLDPDEAVPWEKLVEAVKMIRTALDALGLQGFVKTTGGKGLHVVVPVRPTLQWVAAKAFTKSIAELLVRADPDRFTATISKAKRTGKIFIDYLRNAKDATAVAPYSTRARKGAPVATPIAWSELAQDVRFEHFNVTNVPDRLRRRKDPWAGFFEIEQEITPAMMKQVSGL